ncbi:MAG TPA: HAD family phosphatase [Candidatus Tectomicrobia bacterium]|nr:HAD family phosphatase [Candidatus Tectomicrobia bacterium]
MAAPAVIFDMDGVIVDSEPYSMRALIDVLRQYGIDPTEAEIRRSYGRRIRDDFADYFSRYGVTAHLETAIARKEARYYHLAAGHLKPFPGVMRLLKRLRARGHGLALASSGDRVKVAFGMQALSLDGTFEAVVCGNDVTRSKPDPEIYLLAAQRLKVPPAACVAIEDAPAGVEAAKRAGMRCIAVTNSVAREQLQPADLIVASLADDLSPVLPL